MRRRARLLWAAPVVALAMAAWLRLVLAAPIEPAAAAIVVSPAPADASQGGAFEVAPGVTFSPAIAATLPATFPAATAPATRAAPALPSRPIDRSFGVLLKRSLFARGSTTLAAAQLAAAKLAASGEGNGVGEEATLAFRGVGLSDGQYTAFLEDAAGGGAGVRRVCAGEPLCRGRVVAITLDKLTYEVDGAPRLIALGHNLAGNPMAAPKPAPTTAPTTQPGQPGGPGNAPQPGGPPQPILVQPGEGILLMPGRTMSFGSGDH